VNNIEKSIIHWIKWRRKH